MNGAVKHVESVRTYLVIYAILIALLIATIIAAIFDFGAIGLTIAMGIAVAKALLVVLYFMHVRHRSGVTWVFAGAAVLWLGILISLTMSDYVTRPPDIRQQISHPEPQVAPQRRPPPPRPS
jgi:cytochrome c oxidase subunit 4